MNEQCNRQWHSYPDCEGCPMLGDTCDGSEEWNDEQDALESEDYTQDRGIVGNAKWKDAFSPLEKAVKG